VLCLVFWRDSFKTKGLMLRQWDKLGEYIVLYILKVITLFTFAIVALRMMGKSTLAQFTPHDLMAIVIIAALATKPLLVEGYVKTLLAIALVVAVHLGETRENYKRKPSPFTILFI
jgi:hypothetical protein